MRAFLLLILQAAITLTLLYWIFSDATVREGVGRVVRGADGVWLAWAVAAAGVCVFAGAVRWHVFLRMMRFEVSWLQTTRMAVVSGFFNLFLFGSVGGDAAKVVFLNKLTPNRKSDALLTIVMDHMSEFLVVLLMAIGFTLVRYDYFMQTPLAAGMLWSLILFMSLALVGMVACLVGARWKIADKIWLPAIARQKMREVDAAFSELTRQWRKSVAACLISVLVTLSYFLSFYFASRAVQGKATLAEILTVMPVIDVMAALPISVSGLGVREKSFEELLGVVANVPIEIAVMISLAGFTASLFWSLMGGMVLILQRLTGDRVSLKELRGVTEAPSSAGES